MPVLVTWESPWVSSGASIGSSGGPSTLVVSATSVNEGSLLLGAGGRLDRLGAGIWAVVRLVVLAVAALFVHRRLHHPAVDAGDDADGARNREPEAVDQAVG